MHERITNKGKPDVDAVRRLHNGMPELDSAQNMCGRAYETYSDEELYFQYLNRRPLMRWQLIPDTEPMFSTKLSTINARSESVFDSRLYGDLIVPRRCIVPLSEFFEWKKEGTIKCCAAGAVPASA
jgi:hypothetical protein